MMIRRVAIIGVTVAAIAGTGTAALAASGSPSTTPSSTVAKPAPGSAAAKAARAGRGGHMLRLRKVVHATWVTEDKKAGTFVTHDAIRGQVTAVSATSITVAGADKSVGTFTVNSATKVHTQAKHQGAAITDVKVGDTALVTGTGTSSLLATQVLDTVK